MQAVTTSTQDLDGFTEDGPAYAVELERTGRQFNYKFEYEDIKAVKELIDFLGSDSKEISHRSPIITEWLDGELERLASFLVLDEVVPQAKETLYQFVRLFEVFEIRHRSWPEFVNSPDGRGG